MATFLLRCFCRGDLLDEVAGDLQEVYEWRLARGSIASANYRYFLDAISAIRFYKGGKLGSITTKALIFNFVRSAFRNFKKHWTYTILDLFGLTTAILAALLIVEQVSDETSYDKFSASASIYRVENDYYRFGGMIYESAMTFSGVLPAMLREMPEIEKGGRLFNAAEDWGGSNILTSGEHPNLTFKERGTYFADQAMVDLFDIEVIHGRNGLDEPNTILLSEDIALKYFDEVESAVGQSIKFSNIRFTKDLKVAGIIRLPDFNLQVDLSALISYATLHSLPNGKKLYENNWGNHSFLTYVKLVAQANARQIEEKMASLSLKYKPEYTTKDEQGDYLRVNNYFLTPIRDIHLHSSYQDEVGRTGDFLSVQVLIIITIFILVVAWVNYINIASARSVDRSKEVGLRKVLGAKQIELIGQFFTEALLLNLFALILAVFLLMAFIQPLFNIFIEKELSLFDIDWSFYGFSAFLTFFTGVFASALCPAVILSRQTSIDALKGTLKKGRGGTRLRRFLVSFQLFVTSLLVIGTLVINRQLKFMENRDLGFAKDQVLILTNPTVRTTSGPHERLRLIKVFKEKLAQITGVENVGTSTGIPGLGILRGNAISTIQHSEMEMKSIERVLTDEKFLDILDIEFLAGENFDENKSYPNIPIILNESAARQLGFENLDQAVGQVIYEGTESPRNIVGVIADYHHESLNRPKDPMYFVLNEAWDSFYTIKVTTDEVSETLGQIEQVFSEIYPGNPPEHYFLDEYFHRQYLQDELNGKVFATFSILAIIVACLGLYGLSSFVVARRTKEIGVRKVLGAKWKSLFMLLTYEVALMTLLAFTLAAPVAYYGLNAWLETFAYRMHIGVYLFLIPFLIILFITALSVSQKVIQSILTNPVDSLRYE